MTGRGRRWALCLVVPCVMGVYDGEPSFGATNRVWVEHFDVLPTQSVWRGQMQDLTRMQIVTNLMPPGGHALKLTVHPGDIAAKRERAEISLDHGDPLESEVWYAWRVMIPEDYRDDPAHKQFQIMGQFHVVPDFAAGETWSDYPGVPPMLSVQYGFDEQGSGLGLFYGLERSRKRIALRYIQKGVWHDLTVHIRWSRTDRGFAEAWLNGLPWTPFNGRDYKYYGPNMYNAVPAYFMIGLYRDFGFTTTNSVYYDEVRIGPTEHDVQ